MPTSRLLTPSLLPQSAGRRALLSWESRGAATAQGEGGSRPGVPPWGQAGHRGWEPADTLTHQTAMQKQAHWLQIRTGSHGVERVEQEVA